MTDRVDAKAVFVVHGRDLNLRDAFFDFLSAIGLQPIEWESAVRLTGRTAPYIGEVLDASFAAAQCVLVLLTGDDEATLRPSLLQDHDPPHEREPTPQARANVIFEAGLALGRCPERTILVQIGSIRPFSDLAGRHIVLFDGSARARQVLKERLRTAGCLIDDSGTRWLTAGGFAIERPDAGDRVGLLDLTTGQPKIASRK